MPRWIFTKGAARDVPLAGLETSRVAKFLAIEVTFKIYRVLLKRLHGAILFKTMINIYYDKPFYRRHTSRLLPVIKCLESLGLLSSHPVIYFSSSRVEKPILKFTTLISIFSLNERLTTWSTWSSAKFLTCSFERFKTLLMIGKKVF